LGFATYTAYLASDLWKRIRMMALKRDRFTCRCCGGRATQVHHRKYEYRVMIGERLGDLISLCDPCHEHIEFDDGSKTGTTGAMRRFHQRRREMLAQKGAA
jgi:5-methylcytosine-specific restriction endonuclease McrA